MKVTLPDEDSIVVERAFAAPPDLVWRAHTEAEHLRRWLGRADFPLTTCELDVRVGGHYRWVFRHTESGTSMGVSGQYLVVERPARLDSSEQFDDFPGPSLNRLAFAVAPGGGTVLTLTVRYADGATRDSWYASGMTDGMTEGYARLDAVLDEFGRAGSSVPRQ